MKLKKFILTIVVSFLTCIFCIHSVTAATTDKIDLAVFEVSTQMKQKIDLMYMSIDLQPMNYQNYLDLAGFYYDFEKYDLALPLLERAAQYMPSGNEDELAVFYMIAFSAMETGEWDEARYFIDKFLSIEPNNPDVLGLLAEVAWHDQDIDLTVKAWQQLQNLDPQNFDIYDYFYRKYVVLGEASDEDMRPYLARALELEPDNPKILRAYTVSMRGNLDEDYMKRFDDVLVSLKRVVELAPDYFLGHISLAHTYFWAMINSEYDPVYGKEAIRWAEKAQTIDPSIVSANFIIGATHLFLENYDQAIANLEIAVQEERLTDRANNYLAITYNRMAYDCYERRECLKEGLEYIDKALSLNPENGIYIGTKGELYYALGDFEKAYEYMKKAVELEPEHEEVQRDWAMIQTEMSELKK